MNCEANWRRLSIHKRYMIYFSCSLDLHVALSSSVNCCHLYACVVRQNDQFTEVINQL